MNKIRIVFIYVIMIVTLFSCSKIKQEKTVTTKETEKEQVNTEVKPVDETKPSEPPKPEIIDLTSVINWNGDLHCFDINVNDSAEVVKEKLTKHGKEYESKVDYIGMFQLWNPGYNLVEGIDMDFWIKFYEDTFYSISKSSHNSEDIQTICDKIGIKIDVESLRTGNIHKCEYKYDKWYIRIFFYRKDYSFMLDDDSRYERILNEYMKYE